MRTGQSRSANLETQVETLRGWSDCGGDLESVYTKDEILTNVTLYWLTGTIGSSMRMYAANAAIPAAQHARRVEVPSGFSLFPGDILVPPRAWLDGLDHAVEAAACYPSSAAVGVDLLFEEGYRRHYVLEVNAFGDFFPNLADERGRGVHRAEVEETARALGL